MKSRKAQYSDPFVIMIAVIIYLIIYSVFYLIFSRTGLAIEDQIISAKISSDNDFIIRQYIKMPVKIENKTRIVADLIFDSSEFNNTQNTQITEITEKIMQPYSDRYWRIIVYGISNSSDQKSYTNAETVFADISNKNKRAPFTLPEPTVVQVANPDLQSNQEIYASLYMEDD